MNSITKTCRVEKCERNTIAKQLCGKHYQRVKNGLLLDKEYRVLHGKTNTVEYTTWCSMKARCYNKNYQHFKYYGGRGIKVCDRWLNSFDNFLLDMGKRPGSEYSIERLDTNGDYEPTNCKWVTRKEQANNVCSNTRYRLGNAEYTIAQWSRISGIAQKTITSRIKLGWNLSNAIFDPIKKS